MALLLFACTAKWQYIHADKRQQQLGNTRLELPVGWTIFNKHDNIYYSHYRGKLVQQKIRQIVLTKNGMALDAIYIRLFALKNAFPGIGKPVRGIPLPSELAEMHIAEEKLRHNSLVLHVQRNEPVVVAGRPGYIIHFKGRSSNGLRLDYLVYGFIHQNTLVTAGFFAPSLHYFEAGLSDFSQIVRNIKLQN